MREQGRTSLLVSQNVTGQTGPGRNGKAEQSAALQGGCAARNRHLPGVVQPEQPEAETTWTGNAASASVMLLKHRRLVQECPPVGAIPQESLDGQHPLPSEERAHHDS